MGWLDWCRFEIKSKCCNQEKKDYAVTLKGHKQITTEEGGGRTQETTRESSN